MSISTPVFEARDLQVIRGGSLILNIPTLAIADGEILSLIGPNGAGKSTLLQALSALLKPTRGRILFRGSEIGAQLPVLEYRRKLAMILQDPLLFDTTVYNNVASGLKIRGMKRDRIEPIVNRALERFGIAHLRDRSARTLSGGEARRASMARAFATEPEVLLLDEPFSALDPVIRESLIEDLEHVLHETRMTTIFVTHDRSEAFRLATRIGVMRSGEILQTGSPDEVMNRPLDEFVASMVGIETIIQGQVTRGSNGRVSVSVEGGEIHALGNMQPGERVTLCLRSENVTLLNPGREGFGSEENVFSGRVVKITPFGLYRKILLNCGFPLVASVTNHSYSALSLKEGTVALASFDPVDVHVISKTNVD